MKTLKVIGFVLGGCAALALVLVALATLLVDSTWVRGELTRLIEARTQRTLSIRGGLSLSLWPSLGLRAEQVSLSERQRPEEFAAFESAEVTVDALPLLAGRIRVARVVVTGPRLTLVRKRDGSLNIADLLSREPGQEPSLPPLPAAGIHLHEGTITWRDEPGNRRLVVSGLEFSSGTVESDDSGHIRLGDLRLAAQMAAGDNWLQLALAAALSVDSSGRTYELAPLRGSLTLGHPQQTKALQLPLDGQLRLDLVKSTAGGTLTSQLADSPIRLNLDLSRMSPPDLSFDLAIDRLDLDRYLPLFQGGDDRGERAGAGINPSAGSDMDLRGMIRIGELHFAGSRTRDFRLQVGRHNGRIDVGRQAEPPVVTPAAGSPGRARPDGGMPPGRRAGH